MVATPEIPLNAKSLAQAMNRSPWFVSVMKNQGYEFSHGTRTLLTHALKWLREHPDFRASRYISTGRKRQPRQPVECAGKFGG